MYGKLYVELSSQHLIWLVGLTIACSHGSGLTESPAYRARIHSTRSVDNGQVLNDGPNIKVASVSRTPLPTNGSPPTGIRPINSRISSCMIRLSSRQKKMGSGPTQTRQYLPLEIKVGIQTGQYLVVKECNVSQNHQLSAVVYAYFPTGEYKFMPLKKQGLRDMTRHCFFTKGYNSCVDKCNFSFTMEIHRKFTYKPTRPSSSAVTTMSGVHQ